MMNEKQERKKEEEKVCTKNIEGTNKKEGNITHPYTPLMQITQTKRRYEFNCSSCLPSYSN